MKLNKGCACLAVFFFTTALFSSCSKTGDSLQEIPEGFLIPDERLNLSLMVEDPDIVTPIGIAVDDQDRVFVLESHTHQPPKDYDGPKGDLIKVFEDSNEDGKLDSVKVFAEGIQVGLNISFSPEGHLYVVTSREVWVYYDRDKDGVSEQSAKLLELTEPKSVYGHAAILSIAFSNDGWMYVGRGNNGGKGWVFEGTDGSRVSGYGDGGNIMRAKPDGSQLEEFATGFWNPFDLKFDDYNRLMVADNDPDSRGPNRLVHAVKGGDYGYKSIFGGSGIHAYCAWNGELPGTLPYAAALGEAPSGLLNTSLATLPKDYQDQMLCTIWEESTIVRINLEDKGTSVRGDTEVIIEGGEDFRPVAFAADSKGNIYFTDWVVRNYSNHGRGRIWKLTTRESVEMLERRALYDPVLANTAKANRQTALTIDADFESLKHNLTSEDPFIVHAAVMVLSNGNYHEELIAAAGDPDAKIRLGVLLALKRSATKDVEYLTEKFLSDPDPQIRRMALIWVGSRQMTERRKDLEKVLTAGNVTAALFDTYLETVKLLQPEFVDAYHNKKTPTAKDLKRPLPENFIPAILTDRDQPASIKILALRYLKSLDEHKDLLIGLLDKQSNPELTLEVIQTLRSFPEKDLAERLREIAIDDRNPELIRSEAISSLSHQPLDRWEQVIPLLDDDEENIQIEAARYLRSRISHAPVKKAFEDKLASLSKDTPLKQQLNLAFGLRPSERSGAEQRSESEDILAGRGIRERGRRVFYSSTALCSGCHAIDNRGGDLGPDLSNVGKSKDRNELLSSILNPSEEISPEWQGWYIKLKDGSRHQGRQIDIGSRNIEIYTESKGFVSFDKEDIEDYGLIKNSLMPQGLERNLTDQDLLDLLAFLQQN